MVPMRGLLIVNDAPPPMAPEWHPDPNKFHLVEPPSAADTVREWHQMAPTVGVPTVTSSEEQPLYLDFLPEYVERATRIELAFSAWEKKGSRAEHR